MSSLQTDRTVKFVSKIGTFTTELKSNRGQLWQTYDSDDDFNANIACVPDFNALSSNDKPVVYFVVLSSRTTGSSPLSEVPEFYFNGTKLNNAGSTTILTYNDYFQIVYDATNQRYGLKILKNLVYIAQKASAEIKAVGTISGANFTDEVYAKTTVQIFPSNGADIIVDILDVSNGVTENGNTGSANDGAGVNFTFTAEQQKIKLRADVYKGGVKITSGVTYQWQKIANGAYANITGATGQRTVIAEDEVMTYAKIRCQVAVNGQGPYYGHAPLMDATDPYILDPNPDKEDETISNPGDTVTYHPRVVTRANPTTPVNGVTTNYNFGLFTSAGIDLTAGQNATYKNVSSATGCTVTYAMCEAHGDISVVIETTAEFDDYR